MLGASFMLRSGYTVGEARSAIRQGASPRGDIDPQPLTRAERALVQSANEGRESWSLKVALRASCERRGIPVYRGDDCGTLACVLGAAVVLEPAPTPSLATASGGARGRSGSSGCSQKAARNPTGEPSSD